MKVVLINPPGKSSFLTPPLGLMYVASSLKKAGKTPRILDFMLDDFKEDFLFENIKDAKYIGISAVTPLIHSAISLASLIKKRFPEKKIILGGPHASLLPKETLEKGKCIDYIIKGEGEERIVSLIDYLEGRKVELDGVVFSRGEKIIDLPITGLIENLDAIPFPDRSLIPFERYSDKLNSRRKPACTMITSRGCPFWCIYCSKPIFGNTVRQRSPENIIEEIKYLKEKYNVKEIIFYDDSFTINREHTIRLCQMIIDRNMDISFKCETRVNLVDKDLLLLMKKAGCYLMGYGIESGSQRVLDILKKNTTIEQIKEAVKTTKQAGIEVLGYFMMGIPGETEEDIKETINFSRQLDLDYAQFSIATAFPGTELYKTTKVKTNWSKSFYALGEKHNTSLSDVNIEKLNHYLKKAYYSFYFRPFFIINKIRRINSFSTLKYYLRGLKNILKI